MGKMMRVNMSELRVAIDIEEIPKDYLGLGGRGLTSYIVSGEVPPMADLLGMENKLIFSAGILGGATPPIVADCLWVRKVL
jgi:aldehyde:ferredoxin oxidoreductase